MNIKNLSICSNIMKWWHFFRLYSSLETTTEPHRLTASLECVVCVARALVRGDKHYPEGQTHVIPLLIQTLPGIDPNDIKKCMVRTFKGCTHLFYIVCSALYYKKLIYFLTGNSCNSILIQVESCMLESFWNLTLNLMLLNRVALRHSIIVKFTFELAGWRTLWRGKPVQKTFWLIIQHLPQPK